MKKIFLLVSLICGIAANGQDTLVLKPNVTVLKIDGEYYNIKRHSSLSLELTPYDDPILDSMIIQRRKNN